MINAIKLKKKLHQYIDVASASKLKAIYTLIEDDLQVKFSIDDMQEFNKRRSNHLLGKTKSFTVDESFEFIRNSKK